MDYSQTAGRERVEKAAAALRANGMETIMVENGAEAKSKILEMIPAGAEVMVMTSVTLAAAGVAEAIANSGKYKPARKIFEELDKTGDAKEKRRLGAAPDWAIGSVHAVTEDGSVVIASATGSQLPAYAYGAEKVIWVAGAQKIVADFDEALKRIYEYVLPLESDRARKAYGVSGSAVNKILAVNREVEPGRITVILVNEALGY